VMNLVGENLIPSITLLFSWPKCRQRKYSRKCWLILHPRYHVHYPSTEIKIIIKQCMTWMRCASSQHRRVWDGPVLTSIVCNNTWQSNESNAVLARIS
jgi:hypothetical protein